MTVQKEIEFKNLLQEEEFDQLCNEFGIADQDFQLQTNTYFDTVDYQLRDAFKAFRLRVLGERNELTLKEPGENTHTMIETTQLISNIERAKILNKGEIKPGIYNEFQQLPKILIPFGTLSTKRAEIAYKDGLLVLDRSEYLDHIDFEVEYEVNDLSKGQKHFNELLNTFKIPKRPTMKKIARFMKAANYK
ncbi:CYTH domain-containing protein [Paenisporosarcina sp. TG20]|uniref:CYTH domain-containing protein n=1 Tax=Paenisporosarcina sp. TG20 TaxID=1211706 RepID=UPI000307B044|nr:CYTH domain-containing protein [Paenisporosarcina sp. TG20]